MTKNTRFSPEVRQRAVRMAHAAYPAVASFFPEAVELRLRKISGSLAKDIVTAAQLSRTVQ